MLFKISSAALHGIDAYLVDVEVDVALGIPNFITVGLPDASVRESKERVKAALKNCGWELPPHKITINLAPADRRKEGSSFDLPICLGLLASMGVFPGERMADYLFLGELALDGRLKPVKGVLSATILAKNLGCAGVIIPRQNEKEAVLVGGISVFGLDNLVQVTALLNDPECAAPCRYAQSDLIQPAVYEVDFREVKGQQHVKRALEVAAAGGHNILLIGPPGAGKTMLAQRLPTIMPDMVIEEILEVTKIYSVAGLLQECGAISSRPFRSPHHTITDAALIGGGLIPKPGEVSLAHSGVLFMDELPQFRRTVLEDLRQPVEEGRVTVSRCAASVTYPSAFMFVAAMNPCEDVFRGGGRSQEDCTDAQRSRYYSKISGPLLDRIDIQVDVPEVKFKDIISKVEGEGSEEIRRRVKGARDRQRLRFKGRTLAANSRMTTRDVKKFCRVDEESEKLLDMAVTKLGFSARAYDRVLKVARTIADLAGEEDIRPVHVSEAIQYRMMDKYY